MLTVLTGRVLNRFSADTGLMDIDLPNMFYLFFTVSFHAHYNIIVVIIQQLLLNSFATVVLACVANYWLIIPAGFSLTLLLALRHYFLHSSRNIQRLEALGKVYVHNIITYPIVFSCSS